MCIIDCLSTIVFILPLHLDYTKVIILILWWRNFQLEYWRTFQLVSTGLEVKGGAFLIDNVALLLDAGATWQGGGTDVYTLGVGGRYYFNKIGVFLGADVNLNRYNWDGGDKTRFGFGMEGGYAFFLSRTVTIEPAVYWDINKDRSEFGLKVGFGFYF